MKMRMQELAERSGLPKTTIHHYAREGLLPPAHKSAPNAAEYDEEHLERLNLITHLRGEGAGPLSIPEIRDVLGHVEAGVEVPTAMRLVQEGLEPSLFADAEMKPEAVAASCDVSADFLRTLDGAGLIGARGGDRGFPPEDVVVARICTQVCRDHGMDPADLTPLADLIREVGNYAAILVDVQEARMAAPPADGDTGSKLKDALARLCEALLWRALDRRGPLPP